MRAFKTLLTCVASFISICAIAVDRDLERCVIPSGPYIIDALAVSAKHIKTQNAVIFVGGSGEWEIVETYLKDPQSSYGNMPRFYLEEKFLERGFVFLYLNKRGIGRSTGKWRKSGFSERADDVLAAVEFAKSKYNLPYNAIGLVGHSQGCWITQIAGAQNHELGFIINLAGPFMEPYKQTLINDEEMYKCQRLSDSKVKKKKFWRRKELGLGRTLGPVIGGEAGHWSRIARYDSLKNYNTLHSLKIPTLFVFCEHDVMVPPLQNQQYVERLFPGGLPPNITTYLQNGIDHYMHRANSPCDPYPWTLNPVPDFSDALRNEITRWVESAKSFD